LLAMEEGRGVGGEERTGLLKYMGRLVEKEGGQNIIQDIPPRGGTICLGVVEWVLH